ncbi:hypothetical protein HDV02_005862 [Globomyces sp. JEL0801]|nr:hypothetical protein HDV02_005862 [Globomyces sp. JEL0801]
MKFTLLSILSTSILVSGQVQNSFECIDDTKFKQFVGNSFVINSCPPGFCFTRNPPNKNPCIGRERALAIDGVENAGGAAAAQVNEGAAQAEEGATQAEEGTAQVEAAEGEGEVAEGEAEE